MRRGGGRMHITGAWRVLVFCGPLKVRALVTSCSSEGNQGDASRQDVWHAVVMLLHSKALQRHGGMHAHLYA